MPAYIYSFTQLKHPMKTLSVSILLIFLCLAASAQTSVSSKTKIPFSKHELSLNGFRNPSIGMEYRYKRFSVHAGYYPTIISKNEQGKNETTSFIRTGISYWFLPVYSTRHAPSSFYVSTSYVRGLDQDWKPKNGVLSEVGFKWVVWKGLNLRFGAAMLAGPGQKVKINPTPGISYSIFLK
jgi:hypothetical protein